MFEQREVKCVSLRDGAGVVGMDVVAAVVSRKELSRAARVPEEFVEIDDSVEFAATENPVVDLLAHGLLLGCIESDRFRRRSKLQEGVFERAVGGSNDPDPL